MDLYCLRHGKAIDRDPQHPSIDRERSLTQSGKRKVRCIAQAMSALDLSFDLILTSPFLRARQTAEIVAANFKAFDRLKLTPWLVPGADQKELVQQLNESFRSCETILLVGHEPDLTVLVATLIAGTPNVSLNLRKGGLCKLSVSSLRFGRCATLEWFLSPRQLASLQRC